MHVIYINVGFNDGGEALPGQGGTNEEVTKKMFAQLTEEEKEKLKVYWYTGMYFYLRGLVSLDG